MTEYKSTLKEFKFYQQAGKFNKETQQYEWMAYRVHFTDNTSVLYFVNDFNSEVEKSLTTRELYHITGGKNDSLGFGRLLTDKFQFTVTL